MIGQLVYLKMETQRPEIFECVQLWFHKKLYSFCFSAKVRFHSRKRCEAPARRWGFSDRNHPSQTNYHSGIKNDQKKVISASLTLWRIYSLYYSYSCYWSRMRGHVAQKIENLRKHHQGIHWNCTISEKRQEANKIAKAYCNKAILLQSLALTIRKNLL